MKESLERFYFYLFDEEEDARVCRDIPEEACQEVPRNFFRLGAAQTLTKLADELSSVKTVLPWLLGAAGAPAFWTGLLGGLEPAIGPSGMLMVLAILSAAGILLALRLPEAE